jgi:hypothetical protein
VKTPTQVLAEVERRLARTWTLAASVGSPGSAEQTGWPHEFPLGQPAGRELAERFSATAAWAAEWRDWAAAQEAELRYRGRRVHGTAQELPTHLVVPDADTAASLCGAGWPGRLALGRDRTARVRSQAPQLADIARFVGAVDELDDVDFDLLCRAGAWFASNDARGLTPRQVPIEGLQAKWLNARQPLVRDLAGVEDLGLLPAHPRRIHFTYLDPGYRATGGRWHDSGTVGDLASPAYQPHVVVISENKDTAIHFPEVVGGLSIEGMGRAVGAVASFDWVSAAVHVVYWGDMDADGLEILDGLRGTGIAAHSLLMDDRAYTEWERFGSSTDARGQPLTGRVPRPTPHLNDAELQLYTQLVDPAWTRCRRIEQERIPLRRAAAELLGLMTP